MPITISETDNSTLEVRAEFPGISPDDLFRWFAEPGLLIRWWPQEAVVDGRVGGSYRLSWPAMGWHLNGEYTEFAPGSRLAFTWRWEHEPNLPDRLVTLDFSAAPAGSLLTIHQGTYADTEADQADRQSHIDGWTHFLSQLQATAGG